MSSSRVHLLHLDAIRGLAALMVVLHHAYGFAIGDDIWKFPRLFRPLYHSFLYAHYAVDVFIVLSGYCLMLPVAKSADGRLSNGFWNYVQRRSWRILPPYFAAVALSMLLVALTLTVQHARGGVREALPLWTLGGLLAHLALIHNLSPHWAGQINEAMWSVATEWQIYFVFALLLLPLWRRWGMAAVIAASSLVTVVPYIVFPHGKALEQACPWYVVLFACGMGGALVNFSPSPALVRLRQRLPWRVLPFILAPVALLLFKAFSGSRCHWIEDPIFGLIVAAFLAYLTATAADSPGHALPGGWKVLQSRWAVGLGQFSYSIYLVHLPVLALMRSVIPAGRLSPTVQFVAVIPAEIAAALALSYLFYLPCERPFLKQRDRKARQKAVSVEAPAAGLAPMTD